MVDPVALKAANARRWKSARIVRCHASIARSLVAAKSRYQAVEAKTGVPWPVIAVIHERESSQNWGRSLAQGDPWTRVSVHVPAGRGPFASWEAAAIDALVKCAPYAARNTDWSIGGTLAKLEEYNGLGYALRGMPSPYIWAGTNQYQSGKYVRDGIYDSKAIDTQPGCANLLMAMMTLDPSISFESGKTAAVNTAGAPGIAPRSSSNVPAPPSVRQPSRGSVGAFIKLFLTAVLGRK